MSKTSDCDVGGELESGLGVSIYAPISIFEPLRLSVVVPGASTPYHPSRVYVPVVKCLERLIYTSACSWSVESKVPSLHDLCVSTTCVFT